MLGSHLLLSLAGAAAVYALPQPFGLTTFGALKIRQGQQDSGITGVVAMCKGNNANDRCIRIVNTLGLCITIAPHFAGEIGFMLPPPAAECALFTDLKCTSQPTAGFQQVNNPNQLAWKCAAPGTLGLGANNGGNNGGANGGGGNGANGADGANGGGNGANGGDAGNGGNGGNGSNAGNGGDAGNGTNGGGNGANGGNGGGNGANGGDNGANGGGNGANGGGNGANGGNAGGGNAGNVSNFGSCPPPQIQFGRGFPGRGQNELGFMALDNSVFKHEAALNIGVITEATCLDLINVCGLKNGDPGVDICRRAGQQALQAPTGGAQADKFNEVMGFTTTFANVK